MDEQARQRFLIKLSYQGFLIQDKGEYLILSPRGYGVPAEIVITEVSPNHWQLTAAGGAYTRYQRRKEREWFETMINQFAWQATQETLG